MATIKINCDFKAIGIISLVSIVVTSIFGYLVTPMLIGTKIKVILKKWQSYVPLKC